MIERCLNCHGMNEFALKFEWQTSFENADFENHFYFKLTIESKIKAIFILIPIRAGIYECHYLVDKSVRGRLLKETCSEIFSMFNEAVFYGFTPKNNRPALFMAALLGFKRIKESEEFVLFVR